MIKDVLMFTSDAFSLEAPVDEGTGRRYDLPVGDDIAAYLKERLKGNPGWRKLGIVCEDYGAVLMLWRGKQVFTITVSWQGEDSWGLVFGELRGCFGWLFERKSDANVVMEMKTAVDQIVAGDPARFRTPTWVTNAAFPGIASAFVIPEEPT
jgi:hypothetical protein